ncbi:MAG: hypothetical protein SGPRY_004777, partial [Prymnesium sp.]
MEPSRPPAEVESSRSPGEALMMTLRTLQRNYAELSQRFLQLEASHDRWKQLCWTANDESKFWRREVERLSTLSTAREDTISRLTAALCLSEGPPDSLNKYGSSKDPMLGAAEQQLANKEAEIASMQEMIDKSEQLFERLPVVQAQLDEQIQLTKKADAFNAQLKVFAGLVIQVGP